MPRVSTVQTNFTAGEIGPAARGRLDLNKYVNGVKKLRNFMVRPQGGIFRRQGTIYITETKASGKVVLIEFEVSDTVTYMLEFGHQYIRFMRNEAQILSAGIPYEVVSPYISSELSYLQVDQSGDILYIVHPSHQPKELRRYADDMWVLTDYVNIDGPYLPTNKTDTTLQLSNISDTAYIDNSVGEFAAGDVGKFIEYTKDGVKTIALVTANITPNRNAVTPLDNVLAPLDPTAVLTYGAPTITSSAAIFSNNNVGSYIRRTTGAWHLITAYTSTTTLTVDVAVTLVATTGSLSLAERMIIADCAASADVFAASDIGRCIRFNFSSEQVWGRIRSFVNVRSVTVSLDRPVPIRAYDSRDPSPSTGSAPPPPAEEWTTPLYDR